MKKPPAKSSKNANKTRGHQVEIQQEITVEQSWSGPLPPPSTLSEFNEVVPGAAERIVAAWEKETEHRQKWEKRELTTYIIEAVMSKVFALVFVLAALSVAAYAVFAEQPWVAAILGTGTIGSVVWSFIRSQRK